MSIPAKVREALHERAGSRCEVCGKYGATNAHHRRNASQGGPDVLSNLMLLCGSGTTGCHGYITEHPWRAQLDGYTIQGTQAVPAEVSVWRFNPMRGISTLVFLGDDGSIRDSEEVA